MKNIYLAALSFIVCLNASADNKNNPNPYIPTLEEFAQLSPLSQPQLSPDGQRLAAQCLDGARYGVCVFDLTKKQPPIKFGISEENKISGITWGSSDHVLVWLKLLKQVNAGGALSPNQEVEYRRIYSFNTRTKKGVVLLNNLGGSVSALNRIAAYKLDSNDALMQVTLTEGDALEKRTYLFRVNLDSGRGKQIRSGERNSIAFVLDKDGNPVAQEIMGDRTNQYLVVTSKKSTTIYKEDSKTVSGDVVGVIEDGNALALFLDKGRGWMRLGLDGKLDPLLVDGQPLGEEGDVFLDPYSNSVAGFDYWDHQLNGRSFLISKLGKIQAALVKSFPDDRVVVQSWSKDMATILFSVESVGKPIDFYIFTLADGMVSFAGSQSTFSAGAMLGKKISLEYKASDGLTIPAFVTLPVGKDEKDGPFPTILLPHGGPHAYTDGSYDYLSQFLASLGYMVLEPNYRGSNGYGDAYFRAGFGEFGGKMVSDVLDGYSALVKQKLARKDGFATVGASYGGYSALQLATLAPQSVKAVVAINAVSDPFALLRESYIGSSHFDFWAQYIGEESPASKKAFSVVERAGLFNAPIMLVAGEQDKTVPSTHSVKLAKALQSQKKVVSLIELSAEDHYFQSSITRERLLKETRDWLAKHYPAK